MANRVAAKSMFLSGQFRKNGCQHLLGNTMWLNRAIPSQERNAAHETRPMSGATGNITECRRAEAALCASEEVSRAAFEQAAVGMALVGTDGRWLRVNDKLCTILGYQRDELL